MKFLIQTFEGKVTHDFSFTLLESLRYQNWFKNTTEFQAIFTDDIEAPYMAEVIPCGSVEFVSCYLEKYYGKKPVPRNVPVELFDKEFSQRLIFNGTKKDVVGTKFVKSADQFKKFTDVVHNADEIPFDGNFQISDYIRQVDSEWRAFVYKNELVGLQNYSGDFTTFPNVPVINKMIQTFKPSAPVAYTLDVGVNLIGTFIIEVHDFFSCGLYGFADHRIYPHMLNRWFNEYIQNEQNR